jgi:hypothetical protein
VLPVTDAHVGIAHTGTCRLKAAAEPWRETGWDRPLRSWNPWLMSTYARLNAPRPTFALDMNDEERETMARHAAHRRPNIESGQMVIFGPVLDSTGSWALASWRPMTKRSCGHSPQTIRW